MPIYEPTFTRNQLNYREGERQTDGSCCTQPPPRYPTNLLIMKPHIPENTNTNPGVHPSTPDDQKVNQFVIVYMKKRLPEYTGRHKKECLRTVENPQQEGPQDNSSQMKT